jgi:thiamine biosynthesis lipoprotein
MAAKRRTSRREFLRGRAAADALADLTHGVTDTEGEQAASEDIPVTDHESAGAMSAEVPPSPFLLRLSRRAMACEFEVIVNPRTRPQTAEAAVEALDLVDQLEDQMTVYRDHSEIMDINRRAAADAVKVEPQLFGLLEHALELSRETEGAFDITAGPLAKTWGFYRRRGRMPSDEQIEDTLSRVGSRHVRLNAAEQTVRFDADGIEINLGGIGKGYALDRAAQLLTQRGATDFLLHGGQSSVLARGNRAPLPESGERMSDEQSGDGAGATDSAATETEQDDAGWLIGVKHPLRPRQRLALVRLKDRAIGTSGSGTQFFTHRGQRYGHILDPRTGRPAEGLLSVSVVAEEAATADALATALYVMGIDEARQFCEDHPEIGALLVVDGKRHGSVDLQAIGLSQDDWQRTDE